MNLAVLHEAIGKAIPERECLVFGSRRFSWNEISQRTRKLAWLLQRAELGIHQERSQLANWESGQDAVALYLYNGNEYLEGMLGAYKARCVPFNVNYRYVEDELVYLFNNSSTKAIVYHASFAPRLAKIRDRLPEIRLWLQVADESGEALLPGAFDYESTLADASVDISLEALSDDDLYMLYTGGTTGMPKGVLWRQSDIYYAALAPGRPDDAPKSLEQVVEGAVRGGWRALAAPPFMHGAAHWMAFTMWFSGGTVVVQDNPRKFDPDDLWSTVERERVQALTIVGDAFATPLLDQLKEKSYELDSLRLLTSGGAILSASSKAKLMQVLPRLRVRDTLGSSESGVQAGQMLDQKVKSTTGDFELTPSNGVLSDDYQHWLVPGDDEEGWLARSGHVPLGYLGDEQKTQQTFPVVEGVRYSVPGDRARILPDGRLLLLGRASVTINTGGEKVFAEEVEHALKQAPEVYDAVVVGTPHPRFGQQVTALVQLREAQQASANELRAIAGKQLASYKLPKKVWFVDAIFRAPSGKADYRWAKEQAALLQASASSDR